MTEVDFTDTLDRIFAEENVDALKTILAGFIEPGELSRQYKAQFPRHSAEAARLIAAQLARLQDDQVLERLDRVFESRPDVLRSLAEGWLESSKDSLLQLAEGAWPFAEQPLPRKEWWEAALVFLEEANVQPRWGWFARVAAIQPTGDGAEPEVGSAGPPPEEPDPEIEKLRAEIKRCKEALRRRRAPDDAARDQMAKLSQQLAAQIQKLEHVQQEKAELESEHRSAKQRLEGSERRITKLETRIAGLREQLQACQKSLEAAQKELARSKAAEPCTETPVRSLEKVSIQAPFSPDDISNVWVVPYASLAEQPTERLLTLINLYRAALMDRGDPILATTNWASLDGKPSGVLLLDADNLLHDMVTVPLKRWLETSLFSYETYLYRLRGLVDETEKPLMEKKNGR